jgi:hypothetical protein
MLVFVDFCVEILQENWSNSHVVGLFMDKYKVQLIIKLFEIRGNDKIQKIHTFKL